LSETAPPIPGGDRIAALRDGVLSDPTARTHGLHGTSHWDRVERNGLYLCRFVSADPTIVRLFALFHDCQRQNDHIDPEHGPRAVAYVEALGRGTLGIDAAQWVLLERAMRFHTNGTDPGDVTVSVCWDADRLDIGRVGMPVLARFLFNHEAIRIAREKDFASLDR
jgi:uncharacterized protein